jgi:DNA-binding Lrp family transcriptional regulator
MTALTARESATLDRADRGIVRALQLAPRAPFSGIGAVLGLSEQTVARRYRRLCRDGILRVVAVQNALAQSSWLVRVQCRPDGTASIADALARRDDVSWVWLAAGGSEVVCSVRSRSLEERDELLLRRLPRTAPVLGIAASATLHLFVGERATDWSVFSDELTAGQERRILALGGDLAEPAAAAGSSSPEPADGPLLAVLRRNGRATVAELAAAADVSEGRAARRLSALLSARAIHLEVDLSAQLLGYPAGATLWMTVSPARLHAVGCALAEFPEVAFAAAITGRSNLTASVRCRDLEHLYQFTTEGIGSLPDVQALEVSPVLRIVKQEGALNQGGRLTDVPAQSRSPRGRAARPPAG